MSIHYEEVERGTASNKSFVRYAAVDGTTNQLITVAQWATLMAGSEGKNKEETLFSDFLRLSENLSKIIRECPFRGVFFETKGVTPANAHLKQFEFVLVDAEQLASAEPNPTAFRDYFGTASACQFPNLGGNATLIAPAPHKLFLDGDKVYGDKVYSHLAAFVRGASKVQVAETWQTAATAYSNMLKKEGKQPVWFSTSGLGVAWLHFRLDERPKYYQFAPFAKEE